MPVIIDNKSYYRTAEVFRMLGISRNTLYRWLRKDILGNVERRDSRGWRLFTQDEIDRIKAIVNHITVIKRSVSNIKNTQEKK